MKSQIEQFIEENYKNVKVKVFYELEYYDETQKNYKRTGIKRNDYDAPYFYAVVKEVNKAGKINEGKDYLRFRVQRRVHFNQTVATHDLG